MTPASYAHRIHRVVDHVRGNLSEDLSLAVLAEVAGFSPHHFHRIFKSVTGETVASFTRRARLERAVYLMRGGAGRELGSIALEVGFRSQSDFCRVFRRYYGIAAGSWDRRSRLDAKPDFVSDAQRDAMHGEPRPARVVKHESCRLAYIRVRDPWRGPHLAEGYTKLTRRLSERGIDWRQRALVGLSWDSDKATPIDQLVYDLGISVGEDFRAEGEFGVHELPAVRAVEVHCTSLFEIALAWEYLYSDWLPRSRYEPDHVPALKRFRTTPAVFDDRAWNVDCSIALRPRRP